MGIILQPVRISKGASLHTGTGTNAVFIKRYLSDFSEIRPDWRVNEKKTRGYYKRPCMHTSIGHVNQIVEQHNLRQHYQQVGELFNDFLIAVWELIKTCKFCSDECMQKSLRRPGNRGFKRHGDSWGLVTVAATWVPVQMKTKACSDCGGTWHKAGRQQCPACNQIIYVLTATKFVILQKYVAASKHCLPTNQELMLSMLRLQNRFNCFYWHNNSPSQPLNTMVSTVIGTHEITVLPDSGGRYISSRNWHHGISWLPSR